MNTRIPKLAALALLSVIGTSAMALTSQEKDLAYACYGNNFFRTSGSNGYIRFDTNATTAPDRLQFWRVCEGIEAVEDAYDRTHSASIRTTVGQLLDGLNNLVSGTTDFASWNEYNDDVMWAVIALARGYEITGNRSYLDQAQWQFNKVWDRSWDTQLGGGFWWRADKQTKNACVAGPATIAAMILARNTTNTGYRAQADAIYNWLKSRLVNATTGQVADHIEANGNLVWWAFTYNQGTYAGASTLLYSATGNTTYRDAASRAVSWTRANLTGQHLPDILNDEYDNAGGAGDPVGFKGVFARWAALYANTANDAGAKSWLTANANAAWQYRNSNGLMWGQWWHRTSDAYVTAWECSSALAMTQCAP